MNLRHLVAALFLCLIPQLLYANIGESLQDAEQRAPGYKATYEGFNPTYATDDEQVTMECWSAPSKLWSEAEALSFGQDLAASSGTPRFIEKNGLDKIFELPNGSRIRMMEMDDSQQFISIEVTVSGIGPSCWK